MQTSIGCVYCRANPHFHSACKPPSQIICSRFSLRHFLSGKHQYRAKFMYTACLETHHHNRKLTNSIPQWIIGQPDSVLSSFSRCWISWCCLTKIVPTGKPETWRLRNIAAAAAGRCDSMPALVPAGMQGKCWSQGQMITVQNSKSTTRDPVSGKSLKRVFTLFFTGKWNPQHCQADTHESHRIRWKLQAAAPQLCKAHLCLRLTPFWWPPRARINVSIGRESWTSTYIVLFASAAANCGDQARHCCKPGFPHWFACSLV